MKKILFALSFLFNPLLTYADLNLELPDLGLPVMSGSLNSFGVSTLEEQKGLKILRKLRSSNQIIEDPEINLWIRSLGNTLTAAAPHSSAPFYFLVSKDLSVNAFATRGGVIVINAGLILRTSNESELAAVIAHEIAHITQRHIERMIEKANNNKFATNAALLAGIIASSKDPQAGQAIISTSIATMAHQQLSFSRAAEAEADRVGLRILARARYNPKAMPAFLAKLEQFGNDKNADILEYVQNHPLTLKRITDTQTRAMQLSTYSGKETTRYLYMREKIRANSNSSNKSIPTNIPARIKKYARALLLKQRGNYQSALNLTGNQSKNLSESVLIAQLFNKIRRYKQSINLLNSLINIYPGDLTLSIPLAHALMAANQHEKAWKVISEIDTSEQTSLEYFEVLQAVAQSTRRSSHAYHSIANKNIRTGDYKSASIQLRHAIKLPNSNHHLLEMQRQLTEIKSLIKNH